MDIGTVVLTIDDGREYFQLRDQEGWLRRDMNVCLEIAGIDSREIVDWLVSLSRICSSNALLMNFQPVLQATERDIDKRETSSIADNERDLIQNIYLWQRMSTIRCLQWRR